MNLFITAAFGSQHLVDAARRLASQALETGLYSHVVIVTEDDLASISPHILEWYSLPELSELPGFGYFIWKSAIAEAATSGHWGNFDSVTFLDAGCEIVPGNRSRKSLSMLIDQSKRDGAVVFSTGCPEWQYTKPVVLEKFAGLPIDLKSDQVMGGVWILSGKVGRGIAKSWNDLVKIAPEMTNDLLISAPPGFIAPRHDQSILSMVIKKFGISPQPHMPPFPRDTFLSRMVALRFPIWAARNRSAASTITPSLRLIARSLPRKLR